MHRKSDLQFLEDIYKRESNDIVLVYGDRFCDADNLIKAFIKNKDSFFYNALPLTEEVQKEVFYSQIGSLVKKNTSDNPDEYNLLSPLVNLKSDEKKVLVINDFQHLLRTNPTYISFLTGELIGSSDYGKFMVILVSLDVHFVNDEMHMLIGKKSYEITTVLYIKPLNFTERIRMLSSVEDEFGKLVLAVILGGNQAFYNFGFDSDYKKFITDVILDEDGKYISSLNGYLPEAIRAPEVYNSILYCLAKGINKLNDLHEELNMSRSKILMYMNTLSGYNIVEKCESISAGEKDDTLKGYYRIVNSSARFYYRFIFPFSSLRLVNNKEKFYKKYIESYLPGLVEDYYPFYCMEHIIKLAMKSKLSFEIEDMGEFFDKNDAIDFVIKVKDGNYICCKTQFDGMFMSFQKYNNIKNAIKKYKIDCDNIWLFSKEGFDQKLIMTAGINPMIKLITNKDFVDI